MRTVGQILKEVRVQKNLSLQDIAFALKISARTLSALESSDTKELPAKAFVRGFAKSYARYLKVESEELNSAFNSEFGESESKRVAVEVAAAPAEPAATPTASKSPASSLRKLDKNETEDELSQLNHEGSRRSIVYFGLGLILVIFIGISKRIIDRYQRELVTNNVDSSQSLPENQQKNIKSDATNPLVVTGSNSGLIPATGSNLPASSTPLGDTKNSNNTQAGGVPSGAGTPAANSQTTAAGVAPATTPTSPTMNSPGSPTFGSTPPSAPSTQNSASSGASGSSAQNLANAVTSPQTAPLAKPVAATQNPKLPTPARVDDTPYKLKNVEVIVEALGSIEVEYASKSAAPAKIKLNKGQMHVFKSKSGLKLSFNNGGLARLAVNGKDVGSPGQLGKPTVIIY